ncbi:hypothetical protein [Deinococcus sp.]|uniref:hypothetical protein n=1 Tax=Deinococcus sp. TaxID=47478 RepID=UPI003CC54332
MTDEPKSSDMAPDADEVSLISGLSAGLPGTQPPTGHSPAEQGDAPADLGSRQAPPMQPTSLHGLSAEEVEKMVGGEASATPDEDPSES